jgi:methyl-CpG-binding domain protein 4
MLCQNRVEIPKSPFNLLQEIYIDDPWKILVCCIFLNQTTRKQVDKVRESFFQKWPNPEALANARTEEVVEAIRVLGFYNRRAKTLQKFSAEWTEKKWSSPMELHGIGQYGLDSWKIFVKGEIVDDPSDHVLNDYIAWRKTQF